MIRKLMPLFGGLFGVGMTLCSFAAGVKILTPLFTQQINYDGFVIYHDCYSRSAFAFEYLAIRDEGNLSRRSSFSFDPGVEEKCQQASVGTYKSSVQKYDRGHLVPANHLDHSKIAIYQSNYVTNILPQIMQMNRGAWLETEELIECARDHFNIKVFGGPIYLSNSSNDHFLSIHGVFTPEFYWKATFYLDSYTAWVIPNVESAKRGRLGDYRRSLQYVENFAHVKFLEAESFDRNDSGLDWAGAGCDKS